MTDYRELLLGCGRSRKKQFLATPQSSRDWVNLTTLDINRDVQPDLLCDLNQQPPWHAFPRDVPPEHPDYDAYTGFPAEDGKRHYYAKGYDLLSDYWDEIHAYQVLEHLGQQGDALAFLNCFAELWRILKSNGYLVAACPSRFSGWLWGDPSHRRVIVPESLTFLDQSEYVKQCDGGRPSAMSDFRHIYKADFRLVDQHDNREDFVFFLQAVKPSRWKASER